MTSANLRRCLGFATIVATLYSFVRMEQVGDWVAVPLRVPYSGEVLTDVPIRITKDGFYLVQLEISRKALGGRVDPPPRPPIHSVVTLDGKEIGIYNKSEWYGREWVEFSYYRFPGKIGQHVKLSVRPDSSLSNYKGLFKHLAIERDMWDYGLFIWQQFGWFLLIMIFLVAAVILLSEELKTLARSVASLRKAGS